jgi:hypothetical protein
MEHTMMHPNPYWWTAYVHTPDGMALIASRFGDRSEQSVEVVRDRTFDLLVLEDPEGRLPTLVLDVQGAPAWRSYLVRTFHVMDGGDQIEATGIPALALTPPDGQAVYCFVLPDRSILLTTNPEPPMG